MNHKVSKTEMKMIKKLRPQLEELYPRQVTAKLVETLAGMDVPSDAPKVSRWWKGRVTIEYKARYFAACRKLIALGKEQQEQMLYGKTEKS